jgi:PTH1 family peptidyl-tRNA hydrolase
LWVVIGLGNPGKKYESTRHNAGFILVDRISRRWGSKWKKNSYPSKTSRVERKEGGFLLVKPWTFMNRSGSAVKALIRNTGVELSQMVVVYDDLDIRLGEIRVREKGGPGTHKGMISIVQEIKSIQFPRVRIGIGPLPADAEATDFVLSEFSKDEKKALEHSLDMAEDALGLIVDLKIKDAMNRFNRTAKETGEKSLNEIKAVE